MSLKKAEIPTFFVLRYPRVGGAQAARRVLEGFVTDPHMTLHEYEVWTSEDLRAVSSASLNSTISNMSIPTTCQCRLMNIP